MKINPFVQSLLFVGQSVRIDPWRVVVGLYNAHGLDVTHEDPWETKSELMTRVTERPLGKGQDLLRRNPKNEDISSQDLGAILVVKAFIPDDVGPASIPLTSPNFGDPGEFFG